VLDPRRPQSDRSRRNTSRRSLSGNKMR
jgi:hypothetical protein